MFKAAFNSFSVDNLAKAKTFYTETLGLELANEEMGLDFKLPGGGSMFIYEKADHKPAVFTVLNFVAEDIDKAVAEVKNKGASFEQVDLGNGAKTGKDGIMRGKEAKMGPNIAWLKDPAGNFIAILED